MRSDRPSHAGMQAHVPLSSMHDFMVLHLNATAHTCMFMLYSLLVQRYCTDSFSVEGSSQARQAVVQTSCSVLNGQMSLQGISKNLVNRAFPESNRPDYLTSEQFLKFTPTEDFMSLPGEILRTEFRLVVTHEVGMAPHDMRAHAQ